MSHSPADADQAQRPDRHTELIIAAQDHWASALTDLGGRNTLLYFKARRSGTLDLASASAAPALAGRTDGPPEALPRPAPDQPGRPASLPPGS
jgi:hypothetical protein